MSPTAPAFSGFTPDALRFLQELAANNDRDWFAGRKADYERLIQTPQRALLAALAPAMRAIDPQFETDPRAGAVSRIYRDTRFSKDKQPYRINQWITFRRHSEIWPDRPAYFVGFDLEGYTWGMGFYQASPATMAALRARIAAAPARLQTLMATVRGIGFDLKGEYYKKSQGKYELPPDIADWNRMKTAYICQTRGFDTIFFSHELADTVQSGFIAAAELYHYLMNVAEQSTAMTK